MATPDRYKLAAKRRQLRLEAVNYKGGKCQICGYDKCLAALDFHHICEATKSFNIASKMTSFSAIKEELDKTVLLCANCHREVHDGIHPGYIDHGENYYGEDFEDY